MSEIDELSVKLVQCNELIDEAAGYEVDLANNSELARNLPERKSFRAKQKSEIDWYEKDILRQGYFHGKYYLTNLSPYLPQRTF